MNTSNTRRRGDKGDTPFGKWLRFHLELDSRTYGLDIQNIDYTPFLYKIGGLLILEEKCKYITFPDFNQRDTHSVIDQMCRFASTHPDFRAKRLIQGRPEKITYRGYHLVQFENTSPDNGGIRLNGMPITKDTLILFLRGKWEPFVQYEHLQKHQKLLLDIMKCETQEDITEVKNYIVSNILSNIEHGGPEHELLRKVFSEQSRKVTDELLNRVNQGIREVDGDTV